MKTPNSAIDAKRQVFDFGRQRTIGAHGPDDRAMLSSRYSYWVAVIFIGGESAISHGQKEGGTQQIEWNTETAVRE